uniref:ceramide glucosyltransferase n=1 Tax=Saccoglossus kowalevskii TaxID=10224 RepID=A0ABM0M913_SACKO|nr:PREDICTED: ceramide glucosyltransferase-like isoform X2 [Saccoglossus kowalevskii]
MVSNIVLALTALAGFSSITYAAIIFLHILSIIYCRIHCNKKREPPPPDKAPGISILKPLVGIDPNLADNLESHFTVDYPKYELLFCINDECDPAISIVKPLMSKYPKVDCQLFIGGHPVGINPKINNMMPAYLASKYDFVMISDAGIRISNESIPDLVFHMKDNVGMVHQMPITVHRKGFAALVEMVYFGCAQARVYIGGNLLGFLVPTGMCCLLRKSVLEDGGGIAQFGKYIAEDYFIAKYMLSRGFKVAIGSYWSLQNHGFYSISSHQARMARWSKLRQAMLPTLMISFHLVNLNLPWHG